MHVPMTRPLTLDLGVPSFLNKNFEAKPAGLAPKDACIIRRLGAWKWRLREFVGLVAALHASIERTMGKDFVIYCCYELVFIRQSKQQLL